MFAPKITSSGEGAFSKSAIATWAEESRRSDSWLVRNKPPELAFADAEGGIFQTSVGGALGQPGVFGGGGHADADRQGVRTNRWRGPTDRPTKASSPG
jgi:hypothetical protein